MDNQPPEGPLPEYLNDSTAASDSFLLRHQKKIGMWALGLSPSMGLISGVFADRGKLLPAGIFYLASTIGGVGGSALVNK